jgi:hypothetical protein
MENSTMPSLASNTYDVRPDTKGRVRLRGAEHALYSVKKNPDGSFLFRPRKIANTTGTVQVQGSMKLKTKSVDAIKISRRTLEGMDKAIENLKAGKRSAPAELGKYAKYAK